MTMIEKLITEDSPNYFYPFFWQHGESDEILSTYMKVINESGMKAACVEARPHPDFACDGWWEDVALIIGEARKRNMKLWILDDSHFPTGYANGMIKEKYPQYRKKYLKMRRYDVAGPLPSARIDLSVLGNPRLPQSNDEVILGIYMAARISEYQTDGDPVDENTITDITANLRDRILYLDIPAGSFSLFIVYETARGDEDATKDYLNPLVKEAVEVLLEAVYEPHYEHFKEEFGKTILGFFSDEPRFGNKKGTDCAIGTDMPLPYRDGLIDELPFDACCLPFLWTEGRSIHHCIRVQYMDYITRLYNETFTKTLADWCEQHGVWYLGHNIEDNGAHARLGYGAGHFFRGQEAQHLSGIDVIGGQVVPGQPYHHDAFSTGGSNGEFYHYALARLGSSGAHLEPKKEGRAMCEAYGAYGWNEGLKMMKWITDHLIVRGINYIVPHAFNPKEYPDRDCPPHFYAHGHNPQYRYFKYLTSYVNRMMALTQGAIHKPQTAVLYPAEMEWAGGYMPVERPCRVLTENQIEFDIVSLDHLAGMKLEKGRYIINRVVFSSLIVPWCEYLPEKATWLFERMAESEIPVYFIDEIPKKTTEGKPVMLSVASAVSLPRLAELLSSDRPFLAEKQYHGLVFGDYEKDGQRIWLFFNESLTETVDMELSIPADLIPYEYDAAANKLCQGNYRLCLSPYESAVWILSDTAIADVTKKPAVCHKENEIVPASWRTWFCDSFSYPALSQMLEVSEPCLISNTPGLDSLCGTVCFETTFEVDDPQNPLVLDLGSVYETAEVFINEKSAGVRLCPPYIFDISELIQQGGNCLRIEVTNTLGTANRDGISHYLPIEPFGVAGKVRFFGQR